MARARPTQKDFKHPWYFMEWLEQANPKRSQADAIRELGWSRAKASYVFNGQQYTQALIDEVSSWLGLRPYELLLSPEEAMKIRSVEKAIRLVTTPPAPTVTPEEPQGRTAKRG